MEKSGRKSLFAGLVFFLAACPMLTGQTYYPKTFSKQVDRLFAERIKSSEPGAAVVVTVKGKPVFEKCYGLADVEHIVPITSKP